jgi:hypothetical protein
VKPKATKGEFSQTYVQLRSTIILKEEVATQSHELTLVMSGLWDLLKCAIS